MALVDYFKVHLRRVAGAMGGSSGNAYSRAILAWIRRHGRSQFRTAEITKHLRRFRDDPAALESGLEALEDAPRHLATGGEDFLFAAGAGAASQPRL